MAQTQEALQQQIQAQGDLVRKLKGSKESSDKERGTLSYSLKDIDSHLSQHSYIGGYMPSKSDIKLSESLQNDIQTKKYNHLDRWLKHMKSFSDSEIKLFPAMSYNINKMENTNINDEVG